MPDLGGLGGVSSGARQLLSLAGNVTIVHERSSCCPLTDCDVTIIHERSNCGDRSIRARWNLVNQPDHRWRAYLDKAGVGAGRFDPATEALRTSRGTPAATAL
jgi:hypothetical protein